MSQHVTHHLTHVAQFCDARPSVCQSSDLFRVGKRHGGKVREYCNHRLPERKETNINLVSKYSPRAFSSPRKKTVKNCHPRSHGLRCVISALTGKKFRLTAKGQDAIRRGLLEWVPDTTLESLVRLIRNEPVQPLAHRKFKKQMRQLLQKVGDVNAMVSANFLDLLVGEGHDCPSGSTPLFIASTGNPPSLVSVSLLLAAGADVNLPCDCFFVTHSEVKIPGQTTCLTRAAQQGFLIVVNLLLEQGANLSLGTQKPLTTAEKL